MISSNLDEYLPVRRVSRDVQDTPGKRVLSSRRVGRSFTTSLPSQHQRSQIYGNTNQTVWCTLSFIEGEVRAESLSDCRVSQDHLNPGGR